METVIRETTIRLPLRQGIIYDWRGPALLAIVIFILVLTFAVLV